jgi:hypothetical protein
MRYRGGYFSHSRLDGSDPCRQKPDNFVEIYPKFLGQVATDRTHVISGHHGFPHRQGRAA